MAGLEVKKSGKTYLLDPLGAVTQNGTPAGKWTTDEKNKIIVTQNDGSTLSFDVMWKFNTDNQLVASAGGQEFNFHSVTANRPLFQTRDAVLQIKPHRDHSFMFELQGEWGLSEGHDLTLTVNGEKSVIDGFINDPRSRFMFHFANKKNLLQGWVLGFVGEWKATTDAGGVPRVQFHYKRRGQPDGVFDLPKGVTVNTTINQLMYEYDKKGQKRRIQFVGTLMISEDFQITYALERQTSGAGEQQVGSTTFTFGAAFKKKNFTGDLELAIKKTDGTVGSTTISIKGSFTAVRGTTSLRAGFVFEQTRGADKITTKFGFAGQLEVKNGKIQFAFTTDNTTTKTITLSINADIRLGAAHLESHLNLKLENGQVAGVTFLLGIAI